MSLDYEKCPPNADSMIQSMRAFGYDLKMAVADLIVIPDGIDEILNFIKLCRCQLG